MQKFRGISELEMTRDHSVLTIGNFDGVHLGHQEIFRRVKEESARTGGPACVHTFRPHPQEVLRPGVSVKLLNTYDEKLEIIESLGIDVAVEEPFSQEFFTLTARDFFKKVILGGFKARSLFVGHDFAFGKNREGSLALLEELCRESGVKLTVIPQLSVDGDAVSSTAIRKLLQEGRVAQASKLMGRPFFYRGSVVKGDQRGRLLGFPTANLKLESKLALPHGVYATWALVKRGSGVEKFPSVTNLGVRPTFTPSEGELHVVVETHLILPESQTIDLYGETLEVRFVDRFRDERKFASIDELKEQIFRDREQAKEYFCCVD